ncbi:MAG TPA: 16S rRNA (cytosine(967)-C(5))-methyltransferase RsmB [Candidatus Acidoferrales bacterium]|nr:16S rRNA (cytosine(967)-C(5))-methyltransferase RsmB [Candidatus Acidoferrales bacterium]
MTISFARTIAFDVLLRVAKQDAYADDVLRAELTAAIKSEDAGLATELSLGVLRWQRLLDFAIDRHLRKAAADVEVRIALRLAVYQLLFLDRVPARAAVHESVELVKRARKRSAASFVNAILRKISNEPRPGGSPGESIAAHLPADMPLADRLGLQYSHPTWIVERWLRIFGEEKARALLQANNRVPVLCGYLLDAQRGEDARRSLHQAGCRIEPGRLLREAWVLDGGNPGTSEAVRRGWVAIQDEASQAVAKLVEAGQGNTVLDLCAAPGGKTLLLAHAAGAHGRVIATDLHANRVRAMQERFDLAGVGNVECLALDGSKTLPFDFPVDRILVDVPCSGTGTLARHPEIRWKLRAEDLQDLHARQAALLRNALSHLAPEGRLVYSTCSLEPEENELVAREVLSEFGDTFQIAPSLAAGQLILQPSVPVSSVVGADGFFRTFPSEHGTDGFFAATIVRAKPKA